MEATVFLMFSLTMIKTSIAQDRGIVEAQLRHSGDIVDLAIIGANVLITCEILCDVGEAVELIGPNRKQISSGKCRKSHTGEMVADFGYTEINESLAFGEYKCKYKDRVIEDRASSWVYNYRTCNKTERQGTSETSPKGIFVVDRNDPSCHAVRTCGDRQHVDTIFPRLVCPANEQSICHAAENDKYNMALVAQRFVKSCSEKFAWYVSYAGVPIVLNSLVQLRKDIRTFKIHCPTASDGKLLRRVECEVGAVKTVVEDCTESADVVIDDAVFAGSGGQAFHCDGEGDVYATLIYANPDQNMTCAESKDGSIKCKFEPRLWSKFEVKKSIKCASTEREPEWLSQGDFIIAPNSDQCEEYSIVAEVSYEHPGTHDVFKMPLFESGPFRKKPKQTDCTASGPARTDHGSQTTASSAADGKSCPPCNKSNTSRHTDGDADNSADLLDPGSWYIGISMWSVMQAVMR